MTLPGRILTLQRQVRELGRLRAGQSVPSKTPGKLRPMSSPNWILTSPTRSYLDAAAELWGGVVEEWQPLGNGPRVWRVITERPQVDAILPPGDPLSQFYELWSAGGCQRRCDGEQEQRSGNPCVCVAEHGDEFYKLDRTKVAICAIHTRLSVFLPELPDIGIWRVETHGYWPSVHITGYVETIKALVGEQVMVPVTVAIDPKTRVDQGKTSHYVEIVVALKERVSFGQILAAPQALAIGGPCDRRVIDAAGEERVAIGAAPVGPAISGQPASTTTTTTTTTDLSGWYGAIATADSLEALREVWRRAGAARVNDEGLGKAFWARRAAFSDASGGSTATPEPDRDAGAESVAAEPDQDAAWARVLGLAGERGWNTAEVSQRMRELVGKDPTDASGWDFTFFAEAIEADKVVAS